MDKEQLDLLRELRGDDGYPTEAGLKKIESFTGTPHQLVDILREAMQAYGGVRVEHTQNEWGRDIVEVYMATGGWSGNESILGELRKSFFWFVFWEQSKRGGAFWFHVPVETWDTPMPDNWPPVPAGLNQEVGDV